RGITVKRGSGQSGEDPFVECHTALENGDILVIYPEGTRGKPEELSPFKKGIAYLARHHPNVPVCPMFIRGLGTVMGKRHSWPMPRFCAIAFGEPFKSVGTTADYVVNLKDAVVGLGSEIR